MAEISTLIPERTIDGKAYIRCAWRRKWVRLTPEEHVRQTGLHRLVEQYGYPMSLIAVEVTLADKRADAVVYNRQMEPRMIIEFKADTVPLTQRTLDQIATYNRRLNVPYLMLSNGRETVVAKVEQQLMFLQDIPEWTQL